MMLILKEELNGKELNLLNLDYKNSGEKTFTKLMELKNISTTFRRAQPENKSKLRDLIIATSPVLCEKLVSQGGTQEFTPKKNDLSAWYRPRGRNEF